MPYLLVEVVVGVSSLVLFLLSLCTKKTPPPPSAAPGSSSPVESVQEKEAAAGPASKHASISKPVSMLKSVGGKEVDDGGYEKVNEMNEEELKAALA